MLPVEESPVDAKLGGAVLPPANENAGIDAPIVGAVVLAPPKERPCEDVGPDNPPVRELKRPVGRAVVPPNVNPLVVGPVETAGFPSIKGEAATEAAVPPNAMLLVAGVVVDA